MNLTGTTTVFSISLAALLLVFIYKRLVHKRLHSERWLPLVNRFGRVKGRVALSQYRNLENAPYTVPVVRIIFLYQGRFLLKERPATALNYAHRIDTPFERYVFFGEEVDAAAKASLYERCQYEDIPVRFLFRYYHRSENVNRLVFLYICNIRNGKLLERLKPQPGHWWTGRKVFENLHRGLFPDYFEKEFDFLRSTVLKTEYYSGKAKLQY